jgi:hypothetical protein
MFKFEPEHDQEIGNDLQKNILVRQNELFTKLLL